MQDIELEQAVEVLLAHTVPVAETERVPLLDAVGRVAAEDVRARVLLPAHGGKSHMAGTVPRVAEGERGASLSDGHAAHR